MELKEQDCMKGHSKYAGKGEEEEDIKNLLAITALWASTDHSLGKVRPQGEILQYK